MRAPTYEECLAEAYAIYVRSWHDSHCMWCGGRRADGPGRVPCVACSGVLGG